MFFRKKTKKEEYRTNPFCKPMKVNGETAIKPYFYLRNGYIHIRYTVDRCMKLSPAEVSQLKERITQDSVHKQNILTEYWQFFSDFVKKDIIRDGVTEFENLIQEYSENGRKG